MDPVHLAVAFTPLAIYLLYLGVINLSRRPTVTTGVKNAGAMGLALVGFVAVGPMGLFVPDAAVFAFGPWLWLLLLAFYGLCVTLWILARAAAADCFQRDGGAASAGVGGGGGEDRQRRALGGGQPDAAAGWIAVSSGAVRADAEPVAGGGGGPAELYGVAAAGARSAQRR